MMEQGASSSTQHPTSDIQHPASSIMATHDVIGARFYGGASPPGGDDFFCFTFLNLFSNLSKHDKMYENEDIYIYHVLGSIFC